MPWFAYNVPGHGVRQVYGSNRTEADVAIKAAYPNEPGAADAYQSQTATEDPFTYYQFAGGGTGGGGGGVGATGTGGVTGGLEYTFPQAAYERGLQRQGQNPEGFLSNYLESLYRPAAATFGINRAMGGAPTGDLENMFQESVANTPVQNIRQNATDAFRLLGRPMVSQSQQKTLAGYANPYGAGPEGAADEDKIQNLIALAQQAAATRYSPFAARQLLPGASTVRARYERGGLKGSLYDFLNQQFGLTGGF